MVFEATYITRGQYEIPVYAEVEIDKFGDVGEIAWFYAKNHLQVNFKASKMLTEECLEAIVEEVG